MSKNYVILVLYLLVINVVAFGLFGLDKRAAIRSERRIPESTLLYSAALGGFLGALVGQHSFRHKTKKQPFKTFLYLIGAAQLGLIFWLATKFYRFG